MIRPLAKVLLATVIGICLPFCILLLTPIYVLRWITSKLAKCNPSLGKILTTRSCCVGVDDIYKSPQWTLLLGIIVKGDTSLEDFRNGFLQRAVHAKNEKGQLLKPELSQSITSWLGFLFWKWDPEFRIENHVVEHKAKSDSEPINRDSLFQIGQSLIYAPYPENRSPWELILIKNVDMGDPESGKQQSVIFLR